MADDLVDQIAEPLTANDNRVLQQVAAQETIRRILARRVEFGISRLASVTGLDRAGLPVMQAIRPDSLSNVVSQGKGMDIWEAALSALMESLESWAAETIAAGRTWASGLHTLDHGGLWDELLWVRDRSASNDAIQWIEGWDLVSRRRRPVPLALVDTAYTLPSGHPHWLPRNTTGLAAGVHLRQAVSHACFEILERNAHYHARRTPYFFERQQIDTNSIILERSRRLIKHLQMREFDIGVWNIPASNGVPTYLCHVMESRGMELAPLPGEGCASSNTHDDALSKAILEACQSRLAAIAGSREDITCPFYPEKHDRRQLEEWRLSLRGGTLTISNSEDVRLEHDPLAASVAALVKAGAKAVIVVPLAEDQQIPLSVVRVVAPPLRTDPSGSHHAA